MARRSIFSLFVSICILSCSLGTEVPSPPYMVKQPPRKEALFHVENSEESDRPFFLECKATGNPPPRYRWTKNGNPLRWEGDDDRISRQPGRGTLVIVKPKDDDAGQYQCFAENEHGIATSNSVFVKKAKLDSFESGEPIFVTGNEGHPFKLTCELPDGWPKPIPHWVYAYPDGSLKTFNSSRMTVDPEGNLWFSSLTKADATADFKYACVAMSQLSYEYKVGNSVSLVVSLAEDSAVPKKQEPVLQYLSKKNTVAYLGDQQKLHCIYGGTPLPDTVWYKDGKPIQFSDQIKHENYGKTLVIQVVHFQDEGTYTCEVSNGVGNAKSFSINLKVHAVPYFLVEPQNVNAAEEGTAEFNCVAAGVPEPEIQWIHNGKPIAGAPPNPRRRVNKNKVVIEKLTKQDTGNYGCNATNSLGYVYKDVYVNVL